MHVVKLSWSLYTFPLPPSRHQRFPRGSRKRRVSWITRAAQRYKRSARTDWSSGTSWPERNARPYRIPRNSRISWTKWTQGNCLPDTVIHQHLLYMLEACTCLEFFLQVVCGIEVVRLFVVNTNFSILGAERFIWCLWSNRRWWNQGDQR